MPPNGYTDWLWAPTPVVLEEVDRKHMYQLLRGTSLWSREFMELWIFSERYDGIYTPVVVFAYLTSTFAAGMRTSSMSTTAR